MPNDRIERAARVALVLLTTGSGSVWAQQGRTPIDRWFVATMGGTPVGFVHEWSSDSLGLARTETEMRLVINRLGSQIEMIVASAQRERPQGTLVSISSRSKMSKQ